MNTERHQWRHQELCRLFICSALVLVGCERGDGGSDSAANQRADNSRAMDADRGSPNYRPEACAKAVGQLLAMVQKQGPGRLPPDAREELYPVLTEFCYTASLRLRDADRDPQLRLAMGRVNHLRSVLWLDLEFASSQRNSEALANYRCAQDSLVALEQLLRATQTANSVADAAR